jgi:hypothetical protein
MAIVKQRAIIPLTVSIKEESIAKLVPAGSSTPVADALSARCSQYLEVTADGGLVLRSEELSEIEKNWGKQIRSGQDVVKATMIKAGRTEEGQTRFEGYLDPVWTEPLKVLALESGRSVDELVREVYEMALENNWLYGFKFEGSRHTLRTSANWRRQPRKLTPNWLSRKPTWATSTPMPHGIIGTNTTKQKSMHSRAFIHMATFWRRSMGTICQWFQSVTGAG